MTEEQMISGFAAAFRRLDQHKRELRSESKPVRARAKRRERKIRRLDREIAAVVTRRPSRQDVQ